MIVRRQAPVQFRRGMGALVGSPNCQYQLPGVTPQPGIPICSAAFIKSQEDELAQQVAMTPSGVAFGPGYATYQATQLAAETATNNAVANATWAAAHPAPAPTAPSTPAQSNAPNQTPVGTPGTPAQSNAPNSNAVVPASTPPSGCFALFGSEPCIGPVGLYTLLAGTGGLLLAMSILGGHHR